jgi:hypothetical protein
LPSEELINAALALSILGIVAVYAGYYSGIGDSWGISMPPWRPLWIGESRYPNAMIVLAALIGLSSMAVLGNEIAGVEGQRTVLDTAGLFWLMPLSYCAPFALYMMALNLERESANAARLIAFASMVP